MMGQRLKTAWIAAVIVHGMLGTCFAADWVTVFDTTVNLDRIKYVTPVVCVRLRNGSEPNAVRGTCTFSVVFEGQSYDIEQAQSASFQAQGARDQLTFSVRFGTGQTLKTAADGEKALRPVRALLPK